MAFRARLGAGLLIAACALTVVVARAAHATSTGLPGRSCHLPGYEQSLRCFGIEVPVDYLQASGEKMRLQVIVAPAFREAARPDPVFVLAGGPGQAGSDILRLLDTTFRKARATRDIVFIDQRGTGLSGKLDCDNLQALVEQELPEQEVAIEACMKSLGRPYRFYNTEYSARDLDQVRQALKFERINLWGSSYGTRLGQAYARLFPAQIRSLILDAVVAPDQIIFAWGRDGQAALDRMFTNCVENRACATAYPNLPAQFKSLLRRVAEGSIKIDFSHPRTARQTTINLTSPKFLQTVRAALYSADSRSRLPFLIDSADKGNWQPFLAQMYSTTDISVDGPAIGLLLSIACAEDMSRLTPAIVSEEEGNSFLAASEIKLIRRWCRFVEVPAIPFREPTPIDAPSLLLSGALDPVTPPRRAESAMKQMPHAQHFAVANAGHGISQLGCAPRLLREFLDHPEQALKADCLKEIPPTSFQLGNAGPHP
ncbi:alpha/beta fold hydrolase [soil metagenome]